MQGDCMELMAKTPNKYYDLAIVDPPYGIGEDGGSFRDRKGGGHRVLPKKNGDNSKPHKDYWSELFRVSKNQIVWGGNYFTDSLYESRGWIYWDKLMGGDFSDGELAWTSFDKVLRKVTICNKMKGKIHPTEKPVKVYDFCFIYANSKPNDKILDTHGGSMSIAIACHNLGFDLDCIELDPDYYQQAVKRYENHKLQQRINF